LTKITFTADGLLLGIVDESKGVLYLYASSERDCTSYRYLSCYNLQLKKENIIFFHNIPDSDNSLIIVTEKEVMYVKWWFADNQVHSFSKQIRASVEDDLVTYVCATRTHDSEYLIVADSAGFINIWSINSGYQPIATYRGRVTSLDTYYLKEEGYHIVCIIFVNVSLIFSIF